MTDGDWTVVFESRHLQACTDRSLVLASLSIPHEILHRETRYALVVPDDVAELARSEIRLYERENPQHRARASRPLPDLQNAVPGIVTYIVVVCLVGWLAGEGALDRDWLSAGRIDGELIRQGEWWRILTALTLHSDLSHLLGNIGFGAFFGLLAGRLLGSGLTWLCIVAASGLANTINTLLLASSHRAIGASTAVFAALGLVAGFVWRARLMAQDRWPFRLGPIVGGIALLAYTGTGDENTDVGAHLAGFACGFLLGMALTLLSKIPAQPRFQLLCGAVAIVSIVVSWAVALEVWA